MKQDISICIYTSNLLFNWACDMGAYAFSLSPLHHSIFHLKKIKKTGFVMIHLRPIHFDRDKQKRGIRGWSRRKRCTPICLRTLLSSPVLLFRYQSIEFRSTYGRERQRQWIRTTTVYSNTVNKRQTCRPRPYRCNFDLKSNLLRITFSQSVFFSSRERHQ